METRLIPIKLLSLNKYVKTGKLIFLVCLFLAKNRLVSQINLIQNSGFENYSSLNCVGGPSIVDSWNGFYSPDYYSENCSNVARGVPVNDMGYLYAKNGKSYFGFISFIKTMETKEYIYQYLSSPLISGDKYCLSFFVSKADNVPYSIKNIGAHFSVSLPTMSSNPYLTNIPQVSNQMGFLTDTVNWIEIQGCFIAQGGEQYITIGNFNSNANTDTLYAGTTTQLSGANGYAYYYIDSVTLWQNNFPTFVKEDLKAELVSVYPNPASGEIHFKFADATEKRKVELYDAVGELVLSEEVSTQNSSLNIHHLANGIYFYCILVNGIIVNSNKIVIIK